MDVHNWLQIFGKVKNTDVVPDNDDRHEELKHEAERHHAEHNAPVVVVATQGLDWVYQVLNVIFEKVHLVLYL